MGLPAAAALCITGTLLVLASASKDGHLQVGLFPPCSATLSPVGPCEREGDECPFVFNLPPMTVNLPKQLMDLERLVEELQMLKDNVDELRKICKDCSVSQAEKECKTLGAEEGAHNLDTNTKKWERNKEIADEERREAEKTLAKEKMEQVVAAGENVRITEGEKLDRKQTERDSVAADKHNSGLGKTSPTQNSTHGRRDPRIWQMMDSKTQTEAADEREDGGIKPEKGRLELHDKTIIDEKDISGKSHDTKSGQIKPQEDIVNNKNETARFSSGNSRDRDLWQDKHYKASHEERLEKKVGYTDKNTKQPIAQDRPVWHDKTHVDLNQMETDKSPEERGEKSSDARSRGKNAPKSSQSGRHVWPDETMESSSTERLKLSVRNSSADENFEQDQSKSSQNNGKKDIKDEKTKGERFRQFENTSLMEGTEVRSGSQARVVNSAPSHGFIDLDQAVTLTSPPSFTTSHLTTAVKEGQERQMNGKSSIKKQLGVDVRLARGHEKGEDGGETNVSKKESPYMEYSNKKEDIGKQHKPAKTHALSTFELSTDLKQGNQNIIEPPNQSNVNRKSNIFNHTNTNTTFAKEAKQPTIPEGKIDSTVNADGHFSTVSQGERKPTQRIPSQTSHGENMYAEVSNLDTNLDTKATSSVKYKLDQTKISKTVSTNNDSDVTISPITTNAHFNFNVKQGEHKPAFEIPSQNNPDVKDSKATHANVDQFTPDSTSSPTNSKSRFSQNNEQEHSEARKEPSSPNYSKINHRKEYTHPKIQSYQPIDIDTTTSTPKVPKSKGTAHRDKMESYSILQPNQDEQPSRPTYSSLDIQLPKTTIPITAGTRDGIATTSTTKSSKSQFSKEDERKHIQTNYQEASQGNPSEKHHRTDPSQYVQSAKASAKDETISTPVVSNSHVATLLNKSDQNVLKGPPFHNKHIESEDSDFHSQLNKASRTSAKDEEATTLYPTLSSSHISMHFEKEYGQRAKETPTTSDNNQKELQKQPLDLDISTKFTIQPTGSGLAESSTISVPVASKSHYNINSNTEDQKTLQKTHYGQPLSNDNEKVNDLEMSRVRSQPASEFVEDITSSSPVLRQVDSFKDDIIPTTLTTHQISPFTTPASVTGNKRFSNSRNIPNQRPKPSVGMKPEANPKVKNLKNDHKLDRLPSPDSQVNNDHRQKHPKPKVTPGKTPRPVQIPLKPHQSSSKTRRPDDNVQLLQPRPPAPTSPLAPSETGLHKDKVHRPNVAPVHSETQVTPEEIHQFDKASGGLRKEDGFSKLKHFIQIARNSTGNVTLRHNRLPELNSTTQRIDAGIKKSPKVNLKVPQINQKPKLKPSKVKPVHPKVATSQKVKVEPAPKDKTPKIPKVSTVMDLKNGTKVLPRPKQPNKPVKPKAIPATKIKPKTKENSPKTDMTPTAGSVKLTTVHDLEADPLRQTVTDVFTINPNTEVLSNTDSQTTDPTPSIATTTLPNKPSSTPTPAKKELNQWGKPPRSQAPQVQLGPTAHTASSAFTLYRSTPAPAPHHGPKAPAVESTTPSARELRVKINQVAAFLNKSSPQRPPLGRPLDTGPGEPNEDGKKTEQKPDIQAMRDCSDHMLRGHTHSGLHLVTPDPSGGPVPVLCDMSVDGGGWTVQQRRQDGSVSFNRSWAEYRDGFGQLEGEFWLGNHLLYLLTRDRPMELRVELEDFEGVREYAQYSLFKVASERMRYRLSVDGYSGTAGDALRFSSQYDHNNRAFTTPDRDNDRYPSGNCGAYYNSGWWFDACMAANLNGRYYRGRYKGVRDGIYWGTWHNISTEYYPTNERLAFKSVTMMMRPRGFKH